MNNTTLLKYSAQFLLPILLLPLNVPVKDSNVMIKGNLTARSPHIYGNWVIK